MHICEEQKKTSNRSVASEKWSIRARARISWKQFCLANFVIRWIACNDLAMHTLSYNNKQTNKSFYLAAFSRYTSRCICDRVIDCMICVSLETWWPTSPVYLSYCMNYTQTRLHISNMCMFYRHTLTHKYTRKHHLFRFIWEEKKTTKYQWHAKRLLIHQQSIQCSLNRTNH